jgi:hypothetical protein
VTALVLASGPAAWLPLLWRLLADLGIAVTSLWT